MPHKSKEDAKAWRESRREHLTLEKKKWKLNNPGKVGLQRTNYRLKNSNRGDEIVQWEDLTVEEQNQLNTIYRNAQERSKVSGKWEVDHIIPLSKGGTHTLDNLQVITDKANREKR